MIEVTLPDGSKREFNSPVTVGDVAASILSLIHISEPTRRS